MSDINEPQGTPKEKLLERARDDYRNAVTSENAQRQREEEDLQYQVAEYRWSSDARRLRSGRPTLSVSKLDQPIRLVMNQARAAKLGVSIHPVSEDADDDTAKVFQGLYQRIQRDSNADAARMWALDRAVKAGTGVYRVNVVPDEDSFQMRDLELRIERIKYQSSVVFDPSAQLPDKSDGEFAFVLSWVPWKTFKRTYPESQAVKDDSAGSSIGWEALTAAAPDWHRTSDGGEQAVLVAEYFYKVHEAEKIEDGGKKVRERDVVKVKWCKLTGTEVLDEEDWMGRYIPLVPVVGRELQPWGAETRIEGMIRPAKDAQNFFDYSISNLTERMASEPRTPWIMAEGQDEGHEQEWLKANVENRAVLRYKPTTLGGTLAPPPQRAQLDQTGMSIALQGATYGDQLIQAATATYDPSLGRSSPGQESGRKVLALQSQADAGTSDFLDNLANVSMRLEALIVMDLIPKVYDAPGRVTAILSGDDAKTQKVMLGRPFVLDPKTGRPKSVPAGEQGAKTYDLTKGRYGIAPSVGKSNATRLQEGGEAIGRVLEASPEMLSMIGDIYFGFLDIPGSKEIAERLRKVIEQTHPGLIDDEVSSPQAVQAKLKAAEGQMQQMGQQLEQASQIIQTKQVEQQAKLQAAQMAEETKRMLAAQAMQIEQMQAQLQVRLQQMKSETAITVAEIQAASRAQDSEAQRRQDGIAHALDQQMEAEENDQRQAHEVALDVMRQDNAQRQAAQGMAHEDEQSERGREFESEQGAEERAFAQQQAEQAAMQQQPEEGA